MRPEHHLVVPTCTIEFVRPGITTHTWVQRTVAEVKGGDPLAPATLIVPNYYAGRQIRWTLASAGGYVNVRSMLLGDLAEQVLGAAAVDQVPLTPVLEQSAVRKAASLAGGALAPVAHHPALHLTLLRLFRELRRSELRIADPPSAMAAAALDAFDHFECLIEPYADRTTIRKRAAQLLTSDTSIPSVLRELGALLVVLPSRLDPADIELLVAAARWIPIRVAAAAFGDDELANALPFRVATDLRVVLPSVTSPDTRSTPGAGPPISVIRAPDPSEEIREVVRSIARDIDGPTPIKLHRMAILYRQTDPYGPLVRDALTLAGLPWSALEGRTLAESRPGRALLALLAVRERDFAREAVLGWIDAAPKWRAGLPGAAWDRLSRAANEVRSARQWLDRLDNYAARQREIAAQREAEGNTPAASALRHEADRALAIRADVTALRDALQPPVDGSPWSEFVTWAEQLWTGLCGGANAWTAEDAPFAEDVARTLSALREADVLEHDTGASIELFVVTLHDALDGRARPVGGLGKGILIGPVQSVTGLAFDRVFIVGMTEGAFPTPAPDDPFFPSAAEDPLGLHERQRQSERLAFRTAVAAADGGRLTLSVPDSIQGRKAFPSPWLLELASDPAGIRPLFTTDFQSLTQDAHPTWLRVVRSTVDGIRAAPPLADLEDRRLQESSQTNRLALHAIALRADLPLGAGLAATGARASSDFSAFDGNTEVIAGAGDVRRVIESMQRISASGIEAWATCPFQFFLGRVLRIDATHRPEDGWTVDPLERGSLIHEILERFFKRLRAEGRLDDLDSYSSADYQLVEDIALERFADLERRGVTGHPLVWENTSATIRADLRTFLARDERWRREQRLRPRFIEQPFGMRKADGAWPSLDLDIGGFSIGFRGSIDRVDLDHTGRRAFLYDYKTGSTSAYGGLNDDPVMAGKHVQLMLYRRAVLAALPEVEDVEGVFWFITSRGEFKMLPAEPAVDGDRRLVEVLEATARGLSAGAFPQVPGDETMRPGKFSWENCVYCDFDRICPAGRDAVWERKQAAPGYRLHAALTPGDVE